MSHLQFYEHHSPLLSNASKLAGDYQANCQRFYDFRRGFASQLPIVFAKDWARNWEVECYQACLHKFQSDSSIPAIYWPLQNCICALRHSERWEKVFNGTTQEAFYGIVGYLSWASWIRCQVFPIRIWLRTLEDILCTLCWHWTRFQGIHREWEKIGKDSLSYWFAFYFAGNQDLFWPHRIKPATDIWKDQAWWEWSYQLVSGFEDHEHD